MGFGRGRGFGLGRGYGIGIGRGHGLGKGTFSSYSCVKFVFFAFNVIFWLLGCAVLGIGIWLQVSKGPYASIAPSFNFLSATVLCISAGVLILIIGFFGCCGAIMENQCMLLTYFVLVVVIFLLEIVSSILAFVYRSEIEHAVRKELLDGIKLNYPQGDEEEEGLKKGWSVVQSHLQCCGVDNYTDWHNIKAWETHEKVPEECCVDYSKETGKAACADVVGASKYHTKGCYRELKEKLVDNLLIVGVCCVSIVVIQILGMAAAMVMFCCLRADKYYDE